MQSEVGQLQTRDGIKLYYEIKEKGSPLWLVATHGIGEHLGRHSYLTDLFGHDFNLFQYDLRAHGRSSGTRSWVENFDLFVSDLQDVVDYLQKRYKMERFALFGHSMGALITAQYVQELKKEKLQPELLVLNAPPVGYPGPLGKVVQFSPYGLWNKLASLPLSLPLKGLVDLNNLSHRTEVRDDYENDELNALSLHSNLVLGMVKTSKKVFSRPIRPPCPSYVSVGSADRIVDVQALKEYFTHMDKSFALKIFEGAYHEIHNEIDKYKKPYFDYLKSIFHECRYHDS